MKHRHRHNAQKRMSPAGGPIFFLELQSTITNCNSPPNSGQTGHPSPTGSFRQGRLTRPEKRIPQRSPILSGLARERRECGAVRRRGAERGKFYSRRRLAAINYTNDAGRANWAAINERPAARDPTGEPIRPDDRAGGGVD